MQLAIEDYRRAEGESQGWEIGALLPPMMEGNYEMAAMQCVLPYSEQVRHGSRTGAHVSGSVIAGGSCCTT